MKNIKDRFNRLAVKGIDAVMRRPWPRKSAALFMRYPHIFAAFSYIAGNTIMSVKDNTDINWGAWTIALKENASFSNDTNAGICFLICSAGLFAANRYPVAAYKFAGGICALGGGFLAVDSLNIGKPEIMNVAKLSGAFVQMATGGLLYYKHELQRYAARPMPKDAWQRAAKKIAHPFASSPNISAAVVDITAGAQLFVGALLQDDPGMKAAMLLWLAGGIGLIASDDVSKTGYQRYMTSRNYKI